MVSSLGRVKSALGIISYGSVTSTGYCVSSAGGRRALVHRLVARAFLGPPPTSQHCDVHHKDGNPRNNRLDNLEYVTRSQNISYTWQNPNRGNGFVAISFPVEAKCSGDEEWISFSSIREASGHTSVTRHCIRRCCDGRRAETKGWIFRRVESTTPQKLVGERWAQVQHPDTGRLLSIWGVSSHGRLRSSKGFISYGSETACGYRTVQISSGGVKTRLRVHRLVAYSFIGQRPHGWVVNHKDGNRSNNRVDNLEYVTQAQNIVHSYRSNRRFQEQRCGISKPVWGRQCGSEGWEWFSSGSRAAEALGVHQSSISSVCHGALRTTGGYEFRFAASASQEALNEEEWRSINHDI